MLAVPSPSLSYLGSRGISMYRVATNMTETYYGDEVQQRKSGMVSDQHFS